MIEMPGELDIVMERSQLLRISPNIGIRIKLSARLVGIGPNRAAASIFGLVYSDHRDGHI